MSPLPDTHSSELPVLEGPLSTFGAVVVRPVRDLEENLLWKRLVKAHHYLGFGKLFGHQIKYFAFLGKTPVAALSFSAPSLKLAARDGWIGWSHEERKEHLSRVVSNSRFLIFPNVKVPNLASSVLAKALSRLPSDWEARFGVRPWMVESFVDPSRYLGTSYRAAGFLPLGSTAGYAKTRIGYAHHGRPKELFLFVLDPAFRSTVGLMRPEILEPEVAVELSGWTPAPLLSEESSPLTKAEIATLASELLRFHRLFEPDLANIDQKRLGQAYLAGLVSSIDRKSAEPIALAFLEGPGRVRGLQRFMTAYPWDESRMAAHYRREVAGDLVPGADPQRAMLVVDSSEFNKQGKESVGVSRQYCGRLGKVENCQSGVFVTYTGDRGARFLSAELYLPERWFEEAFRERRQKTGLPEQLVFRTKPRIAGETLQKIVQEGLFPARWIGCDATFGMDKTFLSNLPKDLWYFAAVRSTLHILTAPPQWAVPQRSGTRGKAPTKERLVAPPMTVAEFAKIAAFDPVILKEGSRGPMGAFLHVSRIYRAPPSPLERPEAEWLILQKTLDGELRFALSNAPEDTSFEVFSHVSTLRWSIERCFEEGKSHLGMGHYEHRSYRGWHRHMLYVFLAHHFLQTIRTDLKKKLKSLSPWPKGWSPPHFPKGLPPRKRLSFFTGTTRDETPPPPPPTGKRP